VGAASWDFIRYGSVWEDADVLCDALAPVAPGGRLLSIASAGDNVLALLTLNPAEIVAADLNPAQLACLELRIAAFRRLDHPELLGFLGAAPCLHRDATLRRLRGALSFGARAFWDARPETVRGGVIHAGKFERYLRIFRRRLLPLLHPPGRRVRLRESRSLRAQRDFYQREWDGWRWRLGFRCFFSRPVMGRMGRDPAFFAHVRGSVAERVLARTRHALTELPVRSNPYLAYVVTGTFPPEALPRYLRPEHTDAIRARLDRVRIHLGPVEAAEGGSFDGFNLSDVFEYMSPAEHERCYAALVARAQPGARLAYWNLFVPRARPEALADRVRPLGAEAAALRRRDQAWFYGAFHLDTVLHEVAGRAA
jgi:S-adenosylmethionine-diacylglycerol 3-amino-3-carboxypropyl transferase